RHTRFSRDWSSDVCSSDLQRYALQAKQGRPVYGVEMKIVDDNNQELPRDGKTFGRLLVRGPWIINGYYKNDDRSSFIDGWFDTRSEERRVGKESSLRWARV